MKLADGYELDPAVPLGDLRPHPKNPNQGDVGAIVESIETVGFYGTVTAQKPRNGRKHGRILAGEHRYVLPLDKQIRRRVMKLALPAPSPAVEGSTVIRPPHQARGDGATPSDRSIAS